MGQGTLQELKDICKQHGVHVYSHKDIEDEEHEIYFTPSQYEKIFRAGIKSKNDIVNTDSAIIAKSISRGSIVFKRLEQIKLIELEKQQCRK